MTEKCKDCCSRLFCMSIAEVNGEDFETMANKKDCRKRVFTRADHIRAMSDEDLAEFIRTMVDENYVYDVACYGCINYGTHHSDPANKGTNLYECDGCPSEGIGLDIEKWLKQPVKGDKNDCT